MIEKRLVMQRVSRGVQNFELPLPENEPLPFRRRDDSRCVDGQQFAVQTIVDLASINGDGRFNEFARINHVRRSARMHDCTGIGQGSHQLACATSMIEMDVRQEQPVHRGAIDARFLECRQQSGYGVSGATVDECGSALVDDEVNGIELRHQILGVDGVDAVRVSVSDHRPPSKAALDSKERWGNISDMLTPYTARLTLLLVGIALGLTTTPAAAQTPARETRGNLVLEGVPPHSARVLETLDGWLAGRSATFQDFMPDGSILITTRFGDADQVHHVARPGADRTQLTFDADPSGGASASPVANAPAFLFARDRGGNENAQLYLQQLDTRSTRLLTDGRSRHGGAVWSRDGKHIAFQSNARNGAQQDVYVLDVEGSSGPRLVIASQGQTWTPLDWSVDGKRLLLLDYSSVTDASLYVAEIATGAFTRVSLSGDPTKPSPQSGIGGARFSADGLGIWLTADLGGEFRQLRYVDLTDGSLRTLAADLPWDIDDFDLSADGRWLAYVANVDGFSELQIADLGAGTTSRASGLPAGIISNLRFDQHGRTLGMSIETSISPRDAWTYDIEKSAATRWTYSEMGLVDPVKLVAAQVFRYPTWDRIGRVQRQIPALIHKPTTNTRHPVVIDIHGGPEGQSRPGYSPFMQYLVNELGYAVIQPNVRGSTGYGRSFTMLDNGRLREDSVRDIGALLVWIAAQPDLDPQRVVVMGGSYGGYMVLASLIAYGDRLRGGIDVVGISNFVTFLTNTSGYRRDLRRVEYGDERDPSMRSFLRRISPLEKAEMIRKPLLVVQGLNDPRVPASESEQLVAKVRQQGGEVWYLAAKDEGHGFRKKSNRDFYLRTAATFLERLATP